MHVLLIEDDPAITAGIVDALTGAAHRVSHVGTGGAGLRAVRDEAPDLVVLDLGLPDIDGTDVCRRIRADSSVPIIVISARSEEIDRVLALEMGADDFLVKPFGIRELIARIRAVTRRTLSDGQEAPSTERHLGPLTIDLRGQRITVNDTPVHLTAIEYQLLVYLSQEPGAVRPRSDILREVWKTEWFGATKTLDAHVAALRKKLGSPAWIESVRAVGFRFEIPA
ncbi:MAG: response regulator transcription factor [Acidobacteria bacterium]|jgi:DNA-binding response OmpR family regulator|nr:response regulator transcription factor [Acidobacteriota bacterium]